MGITNNGSENILRKITFHILDVYLLLMRILYRNN